MKFGEIAHAAGRSVKALGLTLALLAAPGAAMAQAPASASPASAPGAVQTAAPAPAASASPVSNIASPAAVAPTPSLPDTPHFAVAPGTYVPMTPTPGKGMPVDDGITFQKQYSPTGEYALWMHNAILLPLITIITLFVLLLLLIVMVRYNRRANPVPSRTSHNTFIEVVWTLVPVLILVGIAVPSMDLLAKQYKPAPAKALTIKATGNQWFWSYTYPDNGGFEVVSNMLNVPGQPVTNSGVREQGSKPYDGPAHLEVDNRMVVPVGEPIRLQTTGADVIHSFAVPSLWFKLDAVPGRINEKVLFVKEPGVYYGQCSELCGARHGYMPIAVEALPRPEFNRWVLSHSGGVIDGAPKAAPAAAGPAAGATPAAAAAVPAAPASAKPAA